MTEIKTESITESPDKEMLGLAMDQDDSNGSDSKPDQSNYYQGLSSQHRNYNSKRRTCQGNKYIPNYPRSKMAKPLYLGLRDKNKMAFAFELDGQQKYTFKKRYFENLHCPSCIMNNYSQIFKYSGIPWWYINKNYHRNYSDFYEGLNAELEDFYTCIRPKVEDEVLRKATFYCISKSIKRIKIIDTVS